MRAIHAFGDDSILFQDFISGDIETTIWFCHFFCPSGKPMAPHLLRCRGGAVKNYSFTPGALKLQHPRFLQQWGKLFCIGNTGAFFVFTPATFSACRLFARSSLLT